MIKEAVEANPKNGPFLDSLGRAYFKLGKMEEAERYLTEAAGVYKSPTLFEHLGDLYEKKGDFDRAATEWRKALELAKGPQAERLRKKLEQASSDQPGRPRTRTQ